MTLPPKPVLIGVKPDGEFIWEYRPAPACDTAYFARRSDGAATIQKGNAK